MQGDSNQAGGLGYPLYAMKRYFAVSVVMFLCTLVFDGSMGDDPAIGRTLVWLMVGNGVFVLVTGGFLLALLHTPAVGSTNKKPGSPSE